MDIAKSTSTILAIVVGIGVSVLALILFSTLTGKTYDLVEDDIDTVGVNVVTAETFTADNSTPVFLGHSDLILATVRITNVTSCTDGSCSMFNANSVNGGNFTFVVAAGSILLTPTIENSWNTSTMYINYTWGRAEIGAAIRGASYGGFKAQESLGDYLPIIVTAIIMMLILTIVIGFTGHGGGETERGSTAL